MVLSYDVHVPECPLNKILPYPEAASWHTIMDMLMDAVSKGTGNFLVHTDSVMIFQSNQGRITKYVNLPS